MQKTILTLFRLANGCSHAQPTFSTSDGLGTVAIGELGEASGATASRNNDQVNWIHNDGGGESRRHRGPTKERAIPYRGSVAVAPNNQFPTDCGGRERPHPTMHMHSQRWPRARLTAKRGRGLRGRNPARCGWPKGAQRRSIGYGATSSCQPPRLLPLQITFGPQQARACSIPFLHDLPHLSPASGLGGRPLFPAFSRIPILGLI